MRIKKQYYLPNIAQFTQNLIDFVGTCRIGTVLLDNDISKNISIYRNHHQFNLIAAINSINSISPDHNKLDALRNFASIKKDWLFGYLAYDLKNEIEKLESNNYDGVDLPDLYFYQPEIVIYSKDKFIVAEYLPEICQTEYVDEVISSIMNNTPTSINIDKGYTFQSRISKKEYIEHVNALKNSIQRGDIYEVNFCQEFFCDTLIDPSKVFKRLNDISPTPFASFFNINHKYLISASPERFIKKKYNKLISQPIKGTIKRGLSDAEDSNLVESLRTNPKEQSENIMIVDLVRNDFSRLATQGSVKVDELCEVYPFRQVHQMISTISCSVDPNINISDVVRATFPMGSMTGAPKVRAMQLIEKHEKTKRGLFSGSVGYITPDNDFDFNVVIRSLICNQEKSYLSFSVGSAITINSDPEAEYQECLLKASGILSTLNATISDAR